MTEDKARKRAVRARMAKTGERYTAARRHLVKGTQPPARERAGDPGMAEESVVRGTGRGWDEWLALLDEWGAEQRTHAEIARHVREEHGVSGWWAQTVAVGYERARGMRAKHERAGGFSVSVSKTFPVPAAEVFHSFTDGRARSRWLEKGTLRVRTAQPGRSARFDFRDGHGRVHVYLTPKGDAKTTVTIEHERLAGETGVEEARAFWKERLARLAARLGSATAGDVPQELRDALDAEPRARRAWERLGASHRREYAAWVAEARRADTRQRRAGQAVEMILEKGDGTG